MGYLVSILLSLLALSFDLSWNYWFPQFSYFRTPPFLLVAVIVALIWGAWPALFVIGFSALLLDLFVLSPSDKPGFYIGDGLLQLITFIVAGVVLAVLAAQREKARRQALQAEAEAHAYADELQQTNAELEQANHLKDRFLSVVSHDLKTPITSISGYAQLLARRLSRQKDLQSDKEASSALVQKIREQTDHITALADELLELTRVQSGNLRLNLERCDLVEITRSMVEDQSHLSGRSIDLVALSGPLLLNGDSERLKRVVANLLSNALKYSPEHSPVEIRLSSHGEKAVLSVHDSGQGIPEQQREHIFKAFYRTPSAQHSSRPGLGLGLAICKEIVEQHNGSIWFESEVDKGSTFYVELPLT